MRAVIVASFTLAACAAAAPRPTPAKAPASTSRPDAGLADMTPAKGADVPSFDELAARGAVDAPLMREVKRIDDVSKPTELEVGTTDGCFRAVVASSAPVKAWFIDSTNAPRGEIAETSAVAALVPPRGPVCAKKGETLRLVLDEPTAGTIARAVVWQSP